MTRARGSVRQHQVHNRCVELLDSVQEAPQAVAETFMPIRLRQLGTRTSLLESSRPLRRPEPREQIVNNDLADEAATHTAETLHCAGVHLSPCDRRIRHLEHQVRTIRVLKGNCGKWNSEWPLLSLDQVAQLLRRQSRREGIVIAVTSYVAIDAAGAKLLG